MDREGLPKKPFIFIFDGPISCSKLFGILLSTHEQLQGINGYPYLLAGSRGPEQIPAKLTEATQQRLVNKWQGEVKQEDLARWSKMTFKQTNEDVTARVKAIEDSGKLPVVQEHAALCIKADISLACLRDESLDLETFARDNPTVADDNLIHDCTPVILVRHPARFIPSFYRKQKKEEMLDLDDEAFQLWISLKWVYILFQFFDKAVSQQQASPAQNGEFKQSKTPVVVDAEDLVHHTNSLTRKLGAVFGIDPEGFKETWEASNDEPVPEGVVASFHDRLRNSKGVERDDAKVKFAAARFPSTYS